MKQILTLLLCLPFFCVFAQEFEPPEMRFGKGIEKDLEQTDYEIVDDDDALYLFDKIDYSYVIVGGELALKETYHARIKVFSKEAVDVGDIKLRFVHEDGYQKISNIKASSFNMEGGKVVESKLSKKDIFNKDVNETIAEITFAIPNVKEGSVIEYEFVKTSKNKIRPGTWYFSNYYPVLYSQVSFNVPEWYQFSYYHRGFQDFIIQKVDGNNQNLSSRYDKVPSSLNVWGKQNVKPYLDEDYTANIDDFREQMQFRLNSVNFPSRPLETFNTTWEKLNQNLLEEDYAEQQKDKKYIEEILAGVIAGKQTEKEKMQAIFDYIVANIEIERDGWIYTSNPVKKVLKDKKGNVADANMLLVNMLQSAGLEAYPMLISTRTDGYIDKLYPNTRAFSYPVAYVKTEKKDLIMNATSSYRPYFLPRVADYNVEGWVVKKANAGWVEVESLTPSSVRFYKIDAQLNADGKYEGDVEVSSSNYLSVSDRINIDDDGVKNRFTELYDGDAEITISEATNEDTSDAYKTFKYSGKFEIENHAQAVNNFIYFSPLLFELKTENPFTQEDRKYPVDFPYPRRTMQTITVTLPEGYVLDEVPKPVKVSFKNIASFTYVITEKEGVLEIMMQDVLNKTVIQPSDYELLKQYYDAIINVINSQITLIKQD